MRDLCQLDRYRLRVPGHVVGGSFEGMFQVPYPRTGVSLRVVASAGYAGWDHVSVSLPNRCPNWPEMSFIKDTFFLPGETAMQLHVPESEHINNHPYCLHLWRPCGVEIPRPPGELVGIKELGDASDLSEAERRAVAVEMNRRMGL